MRVVHFGPFFGYLAIARQYVIGIAVVYLDCHNQYFETMSAHKGRNMPPRS